MKKVILLLLIFITGCTNQYSINISENKIEETIVSSIDNNEIPNDSIHKIYGDIEQDDQINPFIKNEQYPFIDSQEKKYKKKVYEKDGKTVVTLKYNYTYDEYQKSQAYNCFSNRSLFKNNGIYTLNLSGVFNCLYGDEMIINIKTNHSVKSNNADVVNGNTYSWIINGDNARTTNIQFAFSENKIYISPFTFIIIIIIMFGLGYLLFRKVKQKYDNNNGF